MEIELNNAFTLPARGARKLQLGDYQGALEDLNRADEIQPNDVFILSHRGETKRLLDEYERALRDFNLAYKLKPDSAFILRGRGATKLNLGDYQGALEDLNRADDINPNDAFTLRYLGETKRFLDDYEGSLEDFNRADEIEPNNYVILCHRGETKRLLGDYQGALGDFNRADKLELNDAFTLRGRGATKLMLDDLEGALEDLNRSDEIKPNDPFTIHHRAIVRYHLSDFTRALDDVTQLLEWFPFHPDSLVWKKKIEEKIKQTNTTLPKEYSQQVYRTVNTQPIAIQSITSASVFTLPVVQEGVIQVPISELKVIKTIGEGGFSEVSLAEWRGNNVALKKLKSNVIVDDKSHEAKTLMLFHFKFIVNLMAITTDPATNDTILIMEYMKHGSLEDLLFKQHVNLSRASVIRLALDIALGVNYLHSHNPKVLHRDLKSANVLLYRDKTRAKIADFGTAKFLHTNDQAKTVIGNVSIAMPPEMLADDPLYDEKVDVFAFGVVLYEMLTNKRLPIIEENPRLKRIRDNISDVGLMQLVLNCCVSDPTKRPHMHSIIELLRKMKSESN